MNVIPQTENRASREGDSTCRGFLLQPVNITETKEGYVLEAEMPGVNKSGLEVLLEGNELTLVGRRSVGVPNAELLHRESSPRDFRRVFSLDPAIDTARINAKMENGILTLELPKAESVKPRKIAVSE
ncbi:MAG: Hsp20/alpha crystallin family protein [Chloroflexi bacterium]|nr:Hsp20/alpha crystallin family protein [Chloroflexota bacterium]